MATNLRLDADLADALRAAAVETGRSQQDIIRDALAKELGVARAPTQLDQAIGAGLVNAPTPFQDVAPTLRLPEGTTTLDLLDRNDT